MKWRQVGKYWTISSIKWGWLQFEENHKSADVQNLDDNGQINTNDGERDRKVFNIYIHHTYSDSPSDSESILLVSEQSAMAGNEGTVDIIANDRLSLSGTKGIRWHL